MKRFVSIKKERDLKKILSQGKKIKISDLTIIYLEKTSDPTNRFVFLVGKKFSRKASKRNLIKRRLRAIFSQIKIKIKGVDLVIMVRSSLAEKSFAELKLLIESILQKAGLI